MRTIACVLACLSLFAAPDLCAQTDEITVSAALGRQRAFVGDEVQYQITIDGSTAEVAPPRIDWPVGVVGRFINGNSISRTYAQLDLNGRRETTVKNLYLLNYTVLIGRTGTVTIPPVTVVAGGKTYTTNAVQLIAREPTVPDNYELLAEIDETTLYVGQRVHLRLSWVVGDEATPPSLEPSTLPSSFTVLPSNAPAGARRGELYESTLRGQSVYALVSRTILDGRQVPVLEFDIVLEPTEPGVFEVGPMGVVFDRLERGRERTRSMTRSEPLTVTVLEPPTNGRPPGYSGLLGSFEISSRATPTEVGVGDPIELTARLSGREPMPSGIMPPALGSIPGFTDQFQVSGDGWHAERHRPGERLFRTTIRARSPEVDAVPPIPLAMFDPARGAYRVSRSDPIGLSVRAVREVTAADALRSDTARSTTPVRTLERGEPGMWGEDRGAELLTSDNGMVTIGTLTHPGLLAVFVLPPLIWVGVFVARAIGARRDPDRARRAGALHKALRLVRRRSPQEGVRQYLAHTLGRDPRTVSGGDAMGLPGALGDRHVLRDALESTEHARYGASPPTATGDAGGVHAALVRIHRARKRGG